MSRQSARRGPQPGGFSWRTGVRRHDLIPMLCTGGFSRLPNGIQFIQSSVEPGGMKMDQSFETTRRGFLRTLAGTGAGLSLGAAGLGACTSDAESTEDADAQAAALGPLP